MGMFYYIALPHIFSQAQGLQYEQSPTGIKYLHQCIPCTVLLSEYAGIDSPIPGQGEMVLLYIIHFSMPGCVSVCT
jgi:hypothetical protein